VGRMLTPLGALTKLETRAAARRFGLGTAEKPESQEICFVPDDDYVAVLERYLPADAPALARGAIVTTAGEVIGEHDGFARFTIGQRRGLPGGSGQPRYVVAIRPETGEVVVGGDADLLAGTVMVEALNWLDAPLRAGERCEVQVRYRALAVTAVVSETSDSSLSLALEQPVRAVAPGQSAVLYRGEQVLGGGVIV
jgi:tRNA-specific 2-thiouridylase